MGKFEILSFFLKTFFQGIFDEVGHIQDGIAMDNQGISEH